MLMVSDIAKSLARVSPQGVGPPRDPRADPETGLERGSQPGFRYVRRVRGSQSGGVASRRSL